MNPDQTLRSLGKKSLNLIIFSLILLMPTGCGIYSFTGINLDPSIKSIAITNFYNNAGNGPANLSQTLTEELRDYYQSNSPLRITQPEGDLVISGTIMGYDVTPVAPSAESQASLNRLTIRVQVKFVNNFDETKNFESQFSAYEDFAQNQTLSQVEGQLIDVIFERVVYDIFNKTVADW
jgi:hypothetical protein